ncbi:MAG: hypothetical protein FJ215_06085 [Ignavibacteria bacterium]|nr:hypothetical protein [Ignavibacteria bacterium]
MAGRPSMIPCIAAIANVEAVVGAEGVVGVARYVVGEGSVAGPTSRLNAKQPESYVVAENS